MTTKNLLSTSEDWHHLDSKWRSWFHWGDVEVLAWYVFSWNSLTRLFIMIIISSSSSNHQYVCNACVDKLCVFYPFTWILGQELYLLSHLAGSPHKILTGTWDKTGEGRLWRTQVLQRYKRKHTLWKPMFLISGTQPVVPHTHQLHIFSSTAINLYKQAFKGHCASKCTRWSLSGKLSNLGSF